MPGTDTCLGCGQPVDYDTGEHVWLSTALGVTCVRTHPGCEGDAAGNHREQPAKRIPEPVSADEKKKRARRERGKQTRTGGR